MKQHTQAAGPGWVIVLLCLSAAAPHAQAAGRIVDCLIEAGGKVEFDGKCRFTSDGTGGSFSLASRDGQSALYGSILDVSVSIIETGVADVRGLTKDGINARWGEAKRSKQDRACWVGDDFRVCAR